MGNLADPLACVLGNLDLVRPLTNAGIACVVPAGRGIVSHSRLARQVIDLPDETPEAIVQSLVEFGRSRSEAPVLFYQSDADLMLVSRHRAPLSAGLRFAIAAPEVVESLTDKQRWLHLAERLELPVPASVPLDPLEEPPRGLPFPLVLKLASHAEGAKLVPGSHVKAILVRDNEDLRRHWPSVRAAGVTVIAQEWIAGPESAVESYHVYIDATGAPAAEFTGRKIRTYPRRFGASTALEVTEIPDVEVLGRTVVERIGLTGVAKVDVKRDANGRLWLLEVNARFSLWHHLGAAAGMNIPALVWADVTGRARPEVSRPRRSTWWNVDDLRAGPAHGLSPLATLRFAASATRHSGLAWDDPGPLLYGVAARVRARVAQGIPGRGARPARRVKGDAVGMIGLLADIHSNYEALQVALGTLAGAGTERYIVAGDVIGYGPHPNECVAALSQLPGLVAVAGNHELLVRGSLADTALPSLVRRSIAWTRSNLSTESVAFLAALPQAARLAGILITHGAISHPSGYVSYGYQARAQLRLLGSREPDAGLLVLGHTHLPWVYHEQRGTSPLSPDTWIDLDRSARQLVNPGSVGQSRVRERTPKARFAQLDPVSWRVRFWQAEYDHLATRRALRASGQPEELVHHPPSLIASAVRPLRAQLSRLRHGDLPA